MGTWRARTSVPRASWMGVRGPRTELRVSTAGESLAGWGAGLQAVQRALLLRGRHVVAFWFPFPN